MWMLALVIACSTNADVCTYRSEATVTRSQEDCLRLGHFLGGRALVQSYGSFAVGSVDVTCRPLVPPVTVAQQRHRQGS